MLNYFIPRFEEVIKRVLESYQELSFEEDMYPPELLVKIEVKNGRVSD